jgi:hypothetical protein
MKLLITQFPPISSHFISLWSKYPPQHSSKNFHNLLLEMFGCVKFNAQKRNVIPENIKVEVTMQSLATGYGFAD